MKDTSWIKLHRKVLDNVVWRFYPNAWRVFEFLLMKVDRRTGEWSGGRNQIAEAIGGNSNTVYKSLQRLKNEQMIDIVSNNRYSTFSICKWNEYQSSDNNQVTTEQQRSNNGVTTEQHSNKKEKGERTIETKLPKGSLAMPDHRHIELQSLIDHAAAQQFPAQGTVKTNRQYAWLCLQKYGLEPCKRLVDASIAVRGKPYAPTIHDFQQLYKKAGDLASFIKSQQQAKGFHVAL